MKIFYFFYAFLFFQTNTNAQEQLTVYFDFNKAIPNAASKKTLDNWIATARDFKITKVQGFCDSIDSKQFNIQLSNRRAKSVTNILKSAAIKFAKNAEITGFGEDFKQSQTQSDNRKVIIFYQNKALNTTAESEILKPKPSSLETKITDSNIGEKLTLENLNFYNHSDTVLPKSIPILEELLKILKQKPQVVIEIQGHICCMKTDVHQIAYKRAKKVHDYLVENGIQNSRLSFKSFGSTKPIFPLPEKNSLEEDANRRVAIEVIKK